MIPTFTSLLKTLAGKTVLGVVVVSMGVGAAAAADVEFRDSSTPEAQDDEFDELEIDGEDSDDQGEDGDDDGDDQEEAAEEAAEDGEEAADDGGEADDPDGDDPDGDDPDGEEADDEADAADDVSSAEVPEWKIVKTEGRDGPDGWHELRDEKQAEWLEAKAEFNELCGDDDDDSVEPDASGEADAEPDVEMTDECKLFKTELKQLHEDGKSEWKAARDEAKAEWKAIKADAKADAKSDRDQAKAERDAAKADAKAERDAAKADAKSDRDQAKADRSAAKAERKSSKGGK